MLLIVLEIRAGLHVERAACRVVTMTIPPSGGVQLAVSSVREVTWTT